MLKKLSPKFIWIAVATLALTAGCGDNGKPATDPPDGGVVVDAAVFQGRNVSSTVGGAVHASSAHFRMHASVNGGEPGVSAHYQRVGAINGSGQ